MSVFRLNKSEERRKIYNRKKPAWMSRDTNMIRNKRQDSMKMLEIIAINR